MSTGKYKKKIRRVPPGQVEQLFGLYIRALPGLNLSGRDLDAQTIVRVVIPGGNPDPGESNPRNPNPNNLSG